MSLVPSPVPLDCMSKCPWARYWTPNHFQWLFNWFPMIRLALWSETVAALKDCCVNGKIWFGLGGLGRMSPGSGLRALLSLSLLCNLLNWTNSRTHHHHHLPAMAESPLQFPGILYWYQCLWWSLRDKYILWPFDSFHSKSLDIISSLVQKQCPEKSVCRLMWCALRQGMSLYICCSVGCFSYEKFCSRTTVV